MRVPRCGLRVTNPGWREAGLHAADLRIRMNRLPSLRLVDALGVSSMISPCVFFPSSFTQMLVLGFRTTSSDIFCGFRRRLPLVRRFNPSNQVAITPHYSINNLSCTAQANRDSCRGPSQASKFQDATSHRFKSPQRIPMRWRRCLHELWHPSSLHRRFSLPLLYILCSRHISLVVKTFLKTVAVYFRGSFR